MSVPRITVDSIRALYPLPISLSEASDDTEDGAYCVGGAVCFFLGDRRRETAFPSKTYLAEALRKLNTCLRDAPADHAENFADEIIARNDAREFAEAWEIVRQAIAYR